MTRLYDVAARASAMAAVLCAVLALLSSPVMVRADEGGGGQGPGCSGSACDSGCKGSGAPACPGACNAMPPPKGACGNVCGCSPAAIGQDCTYI